MIDFIIYTDCDISKYADILTDGGGNLILKQTTWNDYKRLVSNKLNISYNPPSLYKLTDLKPFLGLIHEEDLKGYDWWGFGDIDLVYGDMSMLINVQMLSKYSLITTHNYHIAGHCTFMRNDVYYNTLCLKINNWEMRLGDDTHYGFDEAEWSNLVYSAIKYPLAIHRRVVKYIYPNSFNAFMDVANRIIHPKELFKEYGTSPAPKRGLFWIYDSRQGKIMSSSGRELPYLHFLFFKKTPWLQTNDYWRKGFYKPDGEISQFDRIIIDIDGIRGE